MSALPVIALAPTVLFATSAFAATGPGRRPAAAPRLSEAAALGAAALALAGLGQLLLSGPAVLRLGGEGPLSLVLRLDAVSATMVALVAFIGWVVMRFSRSYLDGEAREGAFHALMLATLASVLLLVQAGSLAVLILGFVAVGAGLRQLLLFYPERAEARRAAAKFSLVWHGGDLALLIAAACLWSATGTAELGRIAALAPAVSGPLLSFGVAFLILAAVLKTAAFPLHGWLTEVMEAPTPVSALLHAGIINGGGFLLIRMAEAVQTSAGAMAALVMLLHVACWSAAGLWSPLGAFASAMFLLVVWTHRENLLRMARGEEARFERAMLWRRWRGSRP